MIEFLKKKDESLIDRKKQVKLEAIKLLGEIIDLAMHCAREDQPERIIPEIESNLHLIKRRTPKYQGKINPLITEEVFNMYETYLNDLMILLKRLLKEEKTKSEIVNELKIFFNVKNSDIAP